MSQPPAKKSLGQCFLVERSVARQMAIALNLLQGETVLEIGPGRGMLTEELLATGAQVLAVEIDNRLIEPLQAKFGSRPNFSLRHEDILQTPFSEVLPSGTAKVAGNLPYHLVAEVIYKLLVHARTARRDPNLPWISSALLMMQKEVADRIVAHPGTKTWGKLSVFVQLEARAQLVAVVPAAVFRPVPKVDGGIVRFDFHRLPEHMPADYRMLERVVRYCFHQRRKMLKTSLSSLSGVHPFWRDAPLDFTRRPETLTPAEWITLADVITRAQMNR
jgi:16S rRNA (adenine1518-N6/adenine1519-N6)-dimethyltransferase